MARRSGSLAGEDRGVDINIAPLVDVVFLLLIFFVVSAGFLEETGVEVDVPRAASSADLAAGSLLVAVTADGAFVHSGRPLTPDGLRALVSARQRGGPVPVVLVADERAPSGRLVAALDLCKLAGAPTVQVATRAP